ncbi:hypothetical protein FHS78_000952 [Parvibaculum indicum]|uniref:hypothetical protein n=1 Tax=Parvibaculum indicum TaxID=562969 RepID=UPI001421B16C|nr:hypothetical protein [Parvibaculum indicum]NIJ40676.1 hypothetical protein [Parvibaculum indicum]
MNPRGLILLASLLALQAAPGHAAPVHGRLELQDVFAHESDRSVSALLGQRDRNDVLGNLRVTWEPRRGSWRFAFQYQLGAVTGDTPLLAARQKALALFPDAPPRTWWDLTDTTIDGNSFTLTQRIDRLSIGYTGAHIVMRAGRQALTWGSGLVFHPMDLFDPFSPDATDTEYKPGADMLYTQYLFDDGSDLQFVAVPRPPRRGDDPTLDASSFALLFHTALGPWRTSFLAAQDHGDTVAALGVSGALGGATWNAELVPTHVNDDRTYVSALANISDAFTLAGRDATAFAEYYRNGFGLDDRHYSVTGLPAPLTDRLLRGQVFNTGRDYLSLGGTLQWTPLLEIAPTLIANLNDGSFYALGEATWSLEDNLNLIAGAQLPIGPADTEFGGLPVTGAGAPYAEQPTRVYLQLRRYF